MTELGLPELVEEEAGDLRRYYLPTNPPEPRYAWPAAIRTYYYFHVGWKVKISRGSPIQIRMSPEEHKRIGAMIQYLQGLSSGVERHGTEQKGQSPMEHEPESGSEGPTE